MIAGDNLLAVTGEPKFMGFDLVANALTPIKTISTLPETVLPPTG